jgi:hypothetical protein
MRYCIVFHYIALLICTVLCVRPLVVLYGNFAKFALKIYILFLNTSMKKCTN